MASKAPTPNQWVARIKPLSPRKTHVALGISFRREDGWIKVTAEQAATLKKVRLHEMGTDTTRVFDVCLAADAAKLERAQAKRTAQRGTPEKPIDPSVGADAGADELEELDEEEDEEDDGTIARAPARVRPAAPVTTEAEEADTDRLLQAIEDREKDLAKADSAYRELLAENARLRKQIDQEVNEPEVEKKAEPDAKPIGDAPPVAASRPGAVAAPSADAPPKAPKPRPGAANADK